MIIFYDIIFMVIIMFCINCGRECKESELYCGGCGKKIIQTSSVTDNVSNNHSSLNQSCSQNFVAPNNVKVTPKWAIALIIILYCLGILFFLGLVFFSALFTTVNYMDDYEYEYGYISEQTDSYVYINGDRIPTIYELMVEYNMCSEPSFSSFANEEIVSYHYCDIDIDEDVLDRYVDLLVRDYGFVEDNFDDNGRAVSRDSSEEGYIIRVAVYYDYYKVEYSKKKVQFMDEDNSL